VTESSDLRYLPNTVWSRRAVFVYEAARLAALEALAPIVPASWDEREEPFKRQFVDVIVRQCGPERSSDPQLLHELWAEEYLRMGWKYGKIYDPQAKTHPDLVPYTELPQLEKDKDSVFVALCGIARQWIR